MKTTPEKTIRGERRVSRIVPVFPGLLILLLVLTSTGCFIPIHTPAPTDTAGAKLSVTIPRIAPWLAGVLDNRTSPASRSASSRAIAVADTVEIEIRDSDGTIIKSVSSHQAVISDYYPMEGHSFTVTGIPTGTDCTVSVRVYNNLVSEDDPVVSGEATGVDFIAGETRTVTITCLPESPTPITTDGISLSVSSEYLKEDWYSMSVVQGTTYYITTNMYVGVFDLNGIMIDAYPYVEFTADYTGTVFLCLFGLEDGTANLAVYDTKPTLNEGTPDEPVELFANSPHEFRIGPDPSGAYNDLVSFYKFTPETTGTYAVDLEFSMCYVAVYSKPDFTDRLCEFYNYGGIIPSELTGETTYYILIMAENDYKMPSGMGTILDEAAIDADFRSEGSISAPVQLLLGTPESTGVGRHGYDMCSYYRFTTGTGVDYALDISDISSSDSVLYALFYSNSAFSDLLLSIPIRTDGSYTFTLSPGTTYYLMVGNSSMAKDVAVDFDLTVGESDPPEFTTLHVSSSWTEGSIDVVGGTVVYEVPVTPGQAYAVYWDDYFRGSGNYSLDIFVEVYHADRVARYFDDDGGNLFDPDHVIYVPDDESFVYIKVSGTVYGPSDSGEFAVKVDTPPPTGDLGITIR